MSSVKRALIRASAAAGRFFLRSPSECGAPSSAGGLSRAYSSGAELSTVKVSGAVLSPAGISAVRRRTKAFLSVLAPALLLGLLAARPAALAQTSVVLVSNTEGSGSLSDALIYAQAFLTGPDAKGYKLTSVDVKLLLWPDSSGAVLPPDSVEIWSDSSGTPGSRQWTLTNPTTLISGINNFVAPGEGINLAPNTTYHVVWDTTYVRGARNVSMTYLSTANEDPDAAEGWSITDGSHWRYPRSQPGDWTDHFSTYQIAIRGYAKTAAQSPATLTDLVVSDPGGGLDLTPAFSSSTTVYSTAVSNAAVSSVEVTAWASRANATLEGSLLRAGSVLGETVSLTSGSTVTLTGLAAGDNVLTVTVTSADGTATNTYTLTVTRAQQDLIGRPIAPSYVYNKRREHDRGDDYIRVGWDLPANHPYAYICYGTSGDSLLTANGTCNAETERSVLNGYKHTLKGLTTGTVYYIAVARVNAAGVASPYSPIRTIAPAWTAPSAFNATAVDGGITLTWHNPSGTAPTGYNICYGDVPPVIDTDPDVHLYQATYTRCLNKKLSFTTAPTGSHTVTGLTPGITYTFYVQVTGPNGLSFYSSPASATVPTSSDASLSGLALTDASDSPIALDAYFAPETLAHTASTGETSVKVTATVNHARATLAGSLRRAGSETAETVTMTSGSAATLANLPFGANVLTITVTAEDSTTRQYTLTVTRETPPTVTLDPSRDQDAETGTDLTLTGMGADPDGGAVTYAWTATNASNANVTTSVLSGADTDTATFNASTTGVYTVTLTVTDDEGATASAWLDVTVTASSNATLSALSVTTGANAALSLSPAFSSTVEQYSVKPAGSVTTVKVTATATNTGATLAGELTRANGTTANVTMTSGSAATLSGLTKGDNRLAITVTAADNSTKTYTLTVQRYTVPGAVAFTAVANTRGQIRVAWTAPSDTGGRSITLYRLNWGKGNLNSTTTKQLSQPKSHTITGLDNDADYRVLVRALNSEGSRDTNTGYATVRTLADGTPTAAIAGGASRNVALNTDLSLDGSGSTDPDNLGLTYEWTASDGTNTVTDAVLSGADTDMATFNASTAGTYTVTLKVTDKNSGTDTATVTVTAAAPAVPVVTLVLSPTSISENGERTTVTATLDRAASAATTVTVSATPVSPAVAGDFTLSANKTLTIAANALTSTGAVTMTATNNNVDAADKSVTVSGTATSGVTAPQAVTLTITDDDARGVTVSETAVTVAEPSGTDTYTVVLDSQPTADVTVKPLSGATGVATASPATLTFTASDWNTAQTVTVSATDDSVDNASNRTTTITHTVAGGDYAGSAAASVDVTVTDDDTRGVTVSETAVTVAEPSGTDTYTVVLDSQPTANVTVEPLSGATGVATVSPATLTFTSSDWNTAQTVTVSAADDSVDNASNRTTTVTHAVAGGDYAGLAAASVDVTVTDDDTRGVTVSETAVTVAEPSGTGTYTVALNSQPTADVTVTVASSATGIATVSAAALTFTASDWRTAQTVTVTAVDDSVDNPADRTTTITHAVSSTGGYTGVSAASVDVTVTDDEGTAAVTLLLSRSTITEGATDGTQTAAVTARLNVAVATAVTVTVTATPVTPAVAGDFTLSANKKLTIVANTLTSTGTVTITATNNDVDAANKSVTVSAAVTGGVTTAPAAVTLNIADDDVRGVTVSETAVTVAEPSGTGTYTVVLDSQPTANVTVEPASGATGVATVSPATLTFTASNWNTAQTVTVSAANDSVDNAADRTTTITHMVAGGDYASVSAASVDVTVTDDDVRGVTVSETAVTVAEPSGTGTYTVVLNSQPTAAVTVEPASSATGVATASPATLTFTASDWNTAQTVTVSAANDSVDNAANRTTTISHTVAGGHYAGLAAASVDVTVTDDDTRGVTVSETAVTVSEPSGTATYTVALNSQPTAAVTVKPLSGAAGVATVSPATLTFTANDWNTAQTVTVSAANDSVDNPANRTTTISHTVAGGDYASVSAASVDVTVTDNEGAAAVTLMLSRSTITEGATDGTQTAVVTARLNVAVATAVTVAVAATPVTPALAGDFTLSANRVLTIAANALTSTGTVTITATNNEVDAANKSVTVSAAVTGGVTTAPAAVTLNIADDDVRGVTVSETAVTVAEPTGTGTYTVVLTSEPTADVTVEPESGATGVATVSPATLTFTASNWSTAQTVTVSAVDDSVDNTADRTTTISHTVAGGDYASVAAASVDVTVTDDDETVTGAVVSLSLSPASIDESGTATVSRVTASLNMAVATAVTVTVAAAPGAGASAGDFTLSANTTLTITANVLTSTGTVTITAVDNAVDAPNKEVTVTATASGGVTEAPAAVTLTIVDDDPAPVVTLVLGSSSISENGGQTGVTATLDRGSSEATTVTVTAAPGTGASAGDFTLSANRTLTIAANALTSTGTVTITAVDNAVDAADKSVTVSGTASNDQGVTGPSAVALTIADDEDPAVVSSDASLSGLVLTDNSTPLNEIGFVPTFDPGTSAYTVLLPHVQDSLGMIATTTDPHATKDVVLERVDGSTGEFSRPNDEALVTTGLYVGDSVVRITVTATDGTTERVYTLKITRQGSPVPPTAMIDPAGPVSVQIDTDLTLNAEARDPDGGEVMTYAWTAENSSNVDVTGTVLSGANSAAATFNSSAAGAYTVTVTVTDDEGATASASLTVAASVDGPPTAGIYPSGDLTLEWDEGVDLVGVGKDPEGGEVTYGWTAADSGGADVTGTALGSDPLTTGYASFGIAAKNDPETYTVTLTVTDDQGNIAVARKRITVNPDPDAGTTIPAPRVTVHAPAGGDSSATVDWSGLDFNSGGGRITGFAVELKPTGPGAERYREQGVERYKTQGIQFGVGPSETSERITNLDNGAEFTVRVRALGSGLADGFSSAWSKRLTFDTDEGPPNRTEGVAATADPDAGDALDVTWTVPWEGGLNLTGYSVEYKKRRGTAWTAVTVAGSETSTRLVGLARSTAYDVRVAAMNSDGAGQYSRWARATTSAAGTAPLRDSVSVAGAPGVSAGVAVLTWTVGDAGGLAVTKSRVRWKEAGADNPWSGPSTITGASMIHTVTGLDSGKEYVAQVRVWNAVGATNWSPNSARFSPAAADIVPSMPDVTVVPGQRSITFTGATAASEKVIAVLTCLSSSTEGLLHDSTGCLGELKVHPIAPDGGGFSVRVTGLINDTPYRAAAALGNEDHMGPWTDPVSVTPGTPVSQGPPSGISVSSGNGRLMVSWTRPASSQGTPTGYEVCTDYVRPSLHMVPDGVCSGFGMAGPVTVYGADTTSATVSGLKNGRGYYVYVRAVRGSRKSAWTAPNTSVEMATRFTPTVATVQHVSTTLSGGGGSGPPTRIEARVTFTAAVTVDSTGGTPSLGLALGGARREAAWTSGSGTAVLVFALDVTQADTGASTARAIANGLKLNGATIKDGNGSDAELGFGAAPGVSWVSVAGEAGGDGAWDSGEAVTVTFSFTEPVDVDTTRGTPSVGVTLGDSAGRQATYAQGSGTDTLVFTYTLAAADGTVSSVRVPANGLALNRGTIRSTAGLNVGLAHPSASRTGASHSAPGLTVSDASVVEAAGAKLAFALTLSKAATVPVTVSYRTHDGTAVAGEDYLHTLGTISIGVGETSATVEVTVLDDQHDEGTETLTLRVREISGAEVADGSGLGIIRNNDPMPKAWLARFGRTVAEQALGGISRRMKAPRTAGLQGNLGGHSLTFTHAGGAGGGGAAAGSAAAWAGKPGAAGSGTLGGGAAAWAGRQGAAVGGSDPAGYHAGAYDAEASFGAGAARQRAVTARELFLGSSFTLTGAADSNGGSMAFWGRGTETRFEGVEGALDLDGTATSGMLGADYARDRWTFGLALMHSAGEGSYTGDDASGSMPAGGMAGKIESSLTAAVPWAAWRASERVSLWGAAGYGAGDVTLDPEGGTTIETDVDWTMMAAGVRGDLLAPAAGRAGGPALALTADALWARTGSDETAGMVSTSSGATRLRIGLEGSWTVVLGGGARFEPRLEVGARHDGGAAETGAGVDLGGGIAWSDPALGLSIEVEGRTLVAHGDEDRKDQGFAASLAYDPNPATRRGLSFGLSQDWGGRSTGGLDALFDSDPLAGNRSANPAKGRWTAEAAYGFAILDGRFTASPEIGFGLTTTGRDYSLGWKVTPEGRGASALSFGLKATRRESTENDPDHRIALEFKARW